MLTSSPFLTLNEISIFGSRKSFKFLWNFNNYGILACKKKFVFNLKKDLDFKFVSVEKSHKLDWFEKSDPRIGPLPRKTLQQIALRV